MHLDTFLLSLLLMLLLAKILAQLCWHLGLPAVVGELSAGLVLGPSLLGWVQPHLQLQNLAELGVVTLMFVIGCETSIKRLMHSGPRVLTVALSGVLVPAMVIPPMVHWLLPAPPLEALFFGVALTATSIGIAMRVLRLNHQDRGVMGHTILGAAIIDDVLGVLLLGLMFSLSNGDLEPTRLFLQLVTIVLFLMLAPVATRVLIYLLKPLAKRDLLPGFHASTVLLLICLFGWLAYLCGTPPLLGGFAAGLGVSRHFTSPWSKWLVNPFSFTRQLEHASGPLNDVLAPLFFSYVGLSIDLSQHALTPAFLVVALALTTAAVLAKLQCGLWIAASWRQKMMLGSAMVPRGEVGLVFAEMGRQVNLLGAEGFTLLVLVITLTTIVGPVMLKWACSPPVAQGQGGGSPD
ncbi:cation:proton antiporter [Ferrimonas sediminicola]|nr:cation:proton antiporter [Ferrimonas sediminicola]